MMTMPPSFDDNLDIRRYLTASDVPPAERSSTMIREIPRETWEQITANKRMDALFKLPAAQESRLA